LELSSKFQLVLEFTKREFKLNYRNAFFGYIWSLLSPLFMLTALYLVFTYVMSLSIPNYQFFLLIGIICWNFFSEATSRTITFLHSNSNLLGKHRIDPSVLVISSCLSSAITLVTNIVIFLVMAYFFRLYLPVFGILSLFYLILLFFFTLGISFVLAVIYSFFRDLEHIWRLAMLVGFWISPVLYSENVLEEGIRRIYMLNPIARIISHLRNALIYNFPNELMQSLITCVLVLIIFLAGSYIMEAFKKGFGERF